MSLRAVIFDVDGTLAETEDLHRRAFNETFAAQGLDWHWDRDTYRDLLRVTGGKERIAHFLDRRGETPDPAKIGELHRDKTERYGALVGAGKIALRDGIADLIDACRRAGLQLAIATTTSRPNVDALVRATLGQPAEALFDVIAAGDEVAEKKPAPDVYDLALDRLEVAAGDAVALEDSLNGVCAAQAAGLRCVVSPSVYTTHERFPASAWRIDSFRQIAQPGALQTLIGEERTA